jgi:hypothetical protein
MSRARIPVFQNERCNRRRSVGPRAVVLRCERASRAAARASRAQRAGRTRRRERDGASAERGVAPLASALPLARTHLRVRRLAAAAVNGAAPTAPPPMARRRAPIGEPAAHGRSGHSGCSRNGPRRRGTHDRRLSFPRAARTCARRLATRFKFQRHRTQRNGGSRDDPWGRSRVAGHFISVVPRSSLCSWVVVSLRRGHCGDQRPGTATPRRQALRLAFVVQFFGQATAATSRKDKRGRAEPWRFGL